MNNSNSSKNAVSKQHAVRNECGQFAAHIATQTAIINQEQANQSLANWQWLKKHGYTGVQPFEVFAGTGK